MFVKFSTTGNGHLCVMDAMIQAMRLDSLQACDNCKHSILQRAVLDVTHPRNNASWSAEGVWSDDSKTLWLRTPFEDADRPMRTVYDPIRHPGRDPVVHS
jgi:hypothetical protein